MDCIFCNIANQKENTPLLFQDDRVVAFNDIDPQAPHHLLIIPREHILSTNQLSFTHEKLVGHMILVTHQLAVDLKLVDEGYRLVLNSNTGSEIEVPHIHLHLLGGRKMQRPPG